MHWEALPSKDKLRSNDRHLEAGPKSQRSESAIDAVEFVAIENNYHAKFSDLDATFKAVNTNLFHISKHIFDCVQFCVQISTKLS